MPNTDVIYVFVKLTNYYTAQVN